MSRFLSDVLSGALRALLDAAPFLLGGFLVAGLLHEFLKSRPIQAAMGNRSLRSILAGTFLGVPLPLCSCSVLPAAVALRRKGASREATLAFLVSTPETGVDSIALTYGLFGPVIAAVRPLVAILSGIVAGLLALWGPAAVDDRLPNAGDAECDHEPDVDSTAVADPAVTLTARLRRALRHSFGTLFDELAFWLAASFLVAGLLAAALPDGFLSRAFPNELTAIFAMALLGVPTYVCASASTPLAAAMVAKGLNPGAALVFMLTGPATNLGTIAVVGRLFGRRFLGSYLAAIFGVAIGAGLLLNAALAGGSTLASSAPTTTSGFFATVSMVSAFVFVGLLVASARRGSFKHAVKEVVGQGRESLAFLRDLRLRVPWGWVAAAASALFVAVAVPASVVVVRPGEQGLVLLFGRALGRDLGPGWHLVPPPPFGTVTVVATDAIRLVEIGYRSRFIEASPGTFPTSFPRAGAFAAGRGERLPEESQFLTGDENVVEVTAAVLYTVAELPAFQLGVEQVDSSIRSLSRSLLLDEISRTPIDAIYSTDRGRVEARTLAGLAESPTVKRLGVKPIAVHLLYVHAPDDVHRAFRDVASAAEDRSRARNLAQAVAEETVRLATGQAARTVTEAETSRLSGVSRAEGEAEVFTALAAGIRSGPATARQRLYLETVERTLAPLQKVIRPASPEVELWMLPGGSAGVAGGAVATLPGIANQVPAPAGPPAEKP